LPQGFSIDPPTNWKFTSKPAGIFLTLLKQSLRKCNTLMGMVNISLLLFSVGWKKVTGSC
jgi:hypothetical protein